MVWLHGRMLSVGAATLGVVLSTTMVAKASDPIAHATPNPVVASKVSPKINDVAKPKRQLRPELVELRDRVRSVLTAHRQQPFNTHDNTATEILSRCLAFGCTTEVALSGAEGQHINGITCLCWNYPCAGREMIGRGEGGIAARIGYGYQQQPGELLAVLALSRVPADYPVRASGQTVRKVADLVEAEKLACRSGSDMSAALIGLSYYVNQPEWKNSLGQTWSVERMVEEELNRPAAGSVESGTNRLMGLSYAVGRRVKQKQPIGGDFQRAQKYVTDFQRFAFRRQDTDGSWLPGFATNRGNNEDASEQLRASGRTAEWLAMSLPDQRLEEQGMVNAITYLANVLGSERYQWNSPMLSTRDITSIGHALHALVVYDEREFQPADGSEKPVAKKPAAESQATEE